MHCADAGVRFSHLAMAFSDYFAGTTRYVFTEFEVNPFVFTPEGRLIALDGMLYKIRFGNNNPTGSSNYAAVAGNRQPV